MASVKRVFAAWCKPGQGPPPKFGGSLVVHRNRLGSIGSGTVLNSVFFWSYALLRIPAGRFVYRYGVRKTYAIGLLLDVGFGGYGPRQ